MGGPDDTTIQWLTLLRGELMDLPNWAAAREPAFIASLFGHLGTVIAAFVAGQLVPSLVKKGDHP